MREQNLPARVHLETETLLSVRGTGTVVSLPAVISAHSICEALFQILPVPDDGIRRGVERAIYHGLTIPPDELCAMHGARASPASSNPTPAPGLVVPLGERVAALGGTVWKGTKVAQVILGYGRAVGVRMADGREARRARRAGRRNPRLPGLLDPLPPELEASLAKEGPLGPDEVFVMTLLCRPTCGAGRSAGPPINRRARPSTCAGSPRPRATATTATPRPPRPPARPARSARRTGPGGPTRCRTRTRRR